MVNRIMGEDTGDIDLDNIQKMPIKTELSQFNDWDSRTFPEDESYGLNLDVLDRGFKGRVTEIIRLNDYIRSVVKGTGLSKVATKLTDWDLLEAMVARIEYTRNSFNKSRNVVEEKFKVVPRYGSERYEEYLRNFTRLFKFAEEARIVHGLLWTEYTKLISLLELEIYKDHAKNAEYDRIRLEEYDSARKSLYRERRKIVNERKKSGLYV